MIITENQIIECSNAIRAWQVNDNDNRSLIEVIREVLWGPDVKKDQIIYAKTAWHENGPMDRDITIMEVNDELKVIVPPNRDTNWECIVSNRGFEFKVYARQIKTTI